MALGMIFFRFRPSQNYIARGIVINIPISQIKAVPATQLRNTTEYINNDILYFFYCKYSIPFLFCRWGLEYANCTLYRGILCKIVNGIWWWGCTSGNLRSAKNLFIAIASRSPLNRGSTCYGLIYALIDLFKNDSYLIGPFAKQNLKKEITTQKVNVNAIPYLYA